MAWCPKQKANVKPDLCRRMATLCHNGSIQVLPYLVWILLPHMAFVNISQIPSPVRPCMVTNYMLIFHQHYYRKQTWSQTRAARSDSGWVFPCSRCLRWWSCYGTCWSVWSLWRTRRHQAKPEVENLPRKIGPLRIGNVLKNLQRIMAVIQSICSLCSKTSYRQISWSLEAAIFVLRFSNCSEIWQAHRQHGAPVVRWLGALTRG